MFDFDLEFRPGISPSDARHLRRAVELGRRGWGRVHPNPMVGCVVVRDEAVVGEGWHADFGGPHAEVVALREAGPEAAGSTAYVSLEPCRHEGKTPACTAALIRAGVARVVWGAADPGAESGGGGEALLAAGLEVSGPWMEAKAAARENPAFHHRFAHDTAWVELKLATSLDGAINAAGETRTLLTGPETGAAVHRLRSGFDAVMVGARTAGIDDPLLTVREAPAPRGQPVRIVIDSAASLPPTSRLAASAGPDAPVRVFCSTEADQGVIDALEATGTEVHPVPPAAEGGGLDLATVLRGCRAAGVESILCEGGARLGRALIRGGWVRRMHLWIAPRVLGEGALPALDSETGAGWRPIAPPVRYGNDMQLTLEREG